MSTLVFEADELTSQAGAARLRSFRGVIRRSRDVEDALERYDEAVDILLAFEPPRDSAGLLPKTSAPILRSMDRGRGRGACVGERAISSAEGKVNRFAFVPVQRSRSVLNRLTSERGY